MEGGGEASVFIFPYLPPIPQRSPPPSQPSLFHLSEPETQTATIASLLAAVESHVSAPVSKATVAIATELSLLLMILIQHWER